MPTTFRRNAMAIGGLLAAATAISVCKDVTPPPAQVSVTGVSPAGGPLAGGTAVTIAGTNFIDVTSVAIGGTELSSRAVVSPVEITAITPASATSGARDLVVASSSHGSATCGGCFTYNPPVAVTSVSPANGPLAGGTALTIAGTNFVNVTSVTIGGTELSSRTVVSPTEITGYTPTSTVSGGRDVVVASGSHGTATCSGCFTYHPAVTIADVSPGTGPVGGGTVVRITGTNFVNVTSVAIGGSELADRTLVTGTQITGTTPAATRAGPTDVVVISSSHGSGTCLGCFTYQAVTITQVSPSSGPLAGGTTVTIQGVNFVNVTSVTIGGSELANRTTVSPNEITGITPAATNGGVRNVIVTSSTHGSATCVGCFTYISDAVGAAILGAGAENTCATTSSGTAFCWGWNGNGQLGAGSEGGWSTTPVSVIGGLTFILPAVGANHTCGLMITGAGYCWGYNVGRLGNGSTLSSSQPVPISGGLTFTALSAGGNHTCGLTATGTAYCWGYGRSLTPLQVPGDIGFHTLSAGGNHTCGLTVDGTAYCWGDNAYGQLGGASTGGWSDAPVRVVGGATFVAVAAGRGHTCAITSAGLAYCWGRNHGGQLGNGSTTDTDSPTSVSGGLSLVNLAAGDAHTCGITNSGAAYCWGSNFEGALGDGSTANAKMPVAVLGSLSFGTLAAGGAHTCGLVTNGALYCWGRDFYGQLGDGTPLEWMVPGSVSRLPTASLVVAHEIHSCALSSAGAACWGGNPLGQVGTGSFENSAVPVAVSAGTMFTALAAGVGGYHSCGLATSGAAYCWGDNRDGELGDGSTATSPVPVAVSGGFSFETVVVGIWHSCGLTASGAAHCWGNNDWGQLGFNTGSETCHPDPYIVAACSRVPGSVGGGHEFHALTAGAVHTCGLKLAGTAYCWGNNGWDENYTLTPTLVSALLTFVTLTAGGGHTCGLTSGGAAFCWGSNGSGQLGDGSTTSSATPVSVSGNIRFATLTAGGDHTCGVTTTGAAHCWGGNRFGQLGDGSLTDRLSPVAVAGSVAFAAIAGGVHHTCALSNDGAAYCWGRNYEGQLGRGIFGYSSAPVAVAAFGTTMSSAAAVYTHARSWPVRAVRCSAPVWDVRRVPDPCYGRFR